MKEPKTVEEWHQAINSKLGYSGILSTQSKAQKLFAQTPSGVLQYQGKMKKSTSTKNSKDAGDRKETKTMASDSNLIPLADVYLDAGFNVLLLGLHGTGKTASIMEIAKARGIKMKYYSCATLDPFTDLVGVPYPRIHCENHGDFDTRKEHRDLHPECEAPLNEVLKMVRPHDVDQAEVIFFDEFNRADPKTMNAVFEIIQFRSINGEPLPNLKACWAAMNPPDENYEVEKLDPALVDRFDVYIDIQPKPSVSYMAQYIEEEIAKALKLWWDEHERRIKSKTLDSRVDYLSPRRLLKLGLVWEATKNTRSVQYALPLDGTFDRNKLTEYLKQAQKVVDNRKLGITPETEDVKNANIGDAPAQFVYQPGNLRLRKDEVVQALKDNPLGNETHTRVAQAFKQGVGGEELIWKDAEILNALQPSLLEGLFNSFPQAKQAQMKAAFAGLYKKQPDVAEQLTSLHKILKSSTIKTDGFPETL